MVFQNTYNSLNGGYRIGDVLAKPLGSMVWRQMVQSVAISMLNGAIAKVA